MTPEERLELLDDLKTQEHNVASRAAWGAWASVVFAAAVTASLVYLSHRELTRVTAEVNAKKGELEKITTQLAQVKDQLKTTQTTVGALQKVTDEIPKKELDAGFARARQRDPNIDKILPRVYIQTPAGPEAMERAEAAQKKLRQAGFLVPGIEVRPEPVKQTEVRYYKSAEKPEADKVANTLRTAGEKVGEPVYLKRFENSTTVRPNHYEVWLGNPTATAPPKPPAGVRPIVK